MAIYAVSDIHGYYEVFLEGLEKTGFSDKDFLWCLGDMIDRGPEGIRILQYIMEHDNMDLLTGNHELMFLNSVDENGGKMCNGRQADLWLYSNGGQSTYYSYIQLPAVKRMELLDWLRGRFVVKRIDIKDKRYCLTHSFYDPKCEDKRYCELSYNEVWNITWSSIWRDDLLSHAVDIYPKYDYTFVCGHVPVQMAAASAFTDKMVVNTLQSFHYENIINIDGGCANGYSHYWNNGAIFLRLDDMKEYDIYL